jgi:hypothetical protein
MAGTATYFTLIRTGTAGTGQSAQPAPNRRAKSNTYTRHTNIANFLATNFSYKRIIFSSAAVDTLPMPLRPIRVAARAGYQAQRRT